MNGPAHYQEAEQVIRDSQHLLGEARTNVLLEAQVHATLALVAATVRLPSDHKAWALAIIGQPTEGPPK